MYERRRVPRTRAMTSAKIILIGAPSLYDCTTRDLTNLGACLALPSTHGIPSRFELTFDFARSARQCRVVWQTTHLLGVSFELPITSVFGFDPSRLSSERKMGIN